MKSLTTLAVAGLVAGCSAAPGGRGPDTSTSTQETTTPPHAPPASNEAPGARPPPRVAHAVQSVEESLAQLRALQIFAVYGDIEKRNCYAGPCIEDPSTAFELGAPAEARVEDFTAAAVEAAAHPLSDAYQSFEGQVAQDNLVFLRSLQVAEIGELIVAQPQNNPNCYNLPCPSDAKAAADINRDRADRLASIAAALHKAK